MFKAARLRKVLIIGPKTELDWTSRTLHGLSMVHIDDFSEDAGGMKIGQPLERSHTLSKNLIRIRRTISTLSIDARDFPPRQRSVEDIKTFISGELPGVEEEADALVDKRDTLLASIDEKKSLLESIKPLQSISKSARFDIESLRTKAGYCRKDMTATIERISSDIKVQSAQKKVDGKKTNLYLIYYPEKAEKMLGDILELADFREIMVPEFRGSVGQRVSALEAQLSKARKEHEEAEAKISELRDGAGEKLLAAEEYLDGEVEKAELPLRCATTDNFFTIEGWVRRTDANGLKHKMETLSDDKVSVQILEKDEVDKKEPPVLLKHTGPVKQFQFLVDMYSPPNFKEIDPTLILAFIFPMFFGLMIGDIGYGIVLMLLGLILKKRPLFGVGGNAVGNIVVLVGLSSSLFGAFMFGDMFGIPFHAHQAGEITWLGLTGFDYPIHAVVGKLDSHSVVTLLVLSVILGFAHMTLALFFGMINSAAHRDPKHLVSKIGGLLILTAIFVLAMNQAQNTELGGWFTETLMFDIQADAVDIMGIPVPYASLGMGVAGLALTVLTEGAFAIMESLSMLTNLISYTRLAAVGISKAGLAFAMNIIFIEMLMPDNIALFILWLIGFAVVELLLVVLLGALSVGIQALRLHYVEFFMKFYEGGGTPFKPFGPRNMYTRSEVISI